jgi:hypothetical protein
LRLAPFWFPIRNDRYWLAKIINHPSIFPIYLLVITHVQFRAILRRIQSLEGLKNASVNINLEYRCRVL